MNEDEIDISSSESSSSSSSSSSPSSPSESFVYSASTSIVNKLNEHLNLDEDYEFDTSHINKRHTTTGGELTIDDLPAVESLNIKVNVEELSQLGRVASLVNSLVIVQPFKSIPPLDFDSVLFLRDTTPLGKIFDVFGPVIKPMYAIRFNSPQDIEKLNVTVDTPVYYVPDYSPPITSYVFTEDIKKLKGSDASWLDDNEPPEDALDFSDDEQERLSILKRRAKRKLSKLENFENNSIQNLLNHHLDKPRLASSNLITSPSSIAVPPNSPCTPYGENSASLHQPNFGLFSDLTQTANLDNGQSESNKDQ